MKTQLIFCFKLLVLIFLFSACKTNILVLEDVLPSARYEGIEPHFEQSSFADFDLQLTLFYSFRNPYNKSLAIPSHRMGIKLNDTETIRGLWVEKDATVPAKSTITLSYPFRINSKNLQNFLGRENKITFHTSIDLDISEYTNLLPNYNLKVTENFEIDSTKSKQLLQGLLNKKVSKRTLKLEKSISLKLPAPPRISRSREPLLVEWMGDSWNVINLNAIKNTLEPFGDLIIDGKMNNLKNPFVKAMIDAEVTIPNPSVTCPLCTTEIKMADRALDLIRPLDDDIDDKWEGLKNLLYKENEFSPVDYLVDNFLVQINDDADDFWNTFRTGWQTFKNTELPESIPNLGTKGFRISIPINFKNNNSFPIKVPLFRASSLIASGEPFSIQLRTKDMAEISLNKVPNQQADISANQTRTLYVTFSLNWQDSTNGIYDFFAGNELNPNVVGVMSYDFGYGPLFLKYDLQNMDMEYEGGN